MGGIKWLCDHSCLNSKSSSAKTLWDIGILSMPRLSSTRGMFNAAQCVQVARDFGLMKGPKSKQCWLISLSNLHMKLRLSLGKPHLGIHQSFIPHATNMQPSVIEAIAQPIGL